MIRVSPDLSGLSYPFASWKTSPSAWAPLGCVNSPAS
jgi:hypothetical protein